jgi:hypothetical protein
MPITVKSIVLWRKDIENQPGTLATTWIHLPAEAQTSRS